MNNLNLIDNNLNRTVNRFTFKRYDNDIDILVFLNKRLGLSLSCIGNHCNKQGSAIHHYINGINRMSEQTRENIKGLLGFSLTRLEQIITDKRDELPNSAYVELNNIVQEGRAILTPHMRNAKTRQAKRYKSMT